MLCRLHIVFSSRHVNEFSSYLENIILLQRGIPGLVGLFRHWESDLGLGKSQVQIKRIRIPLAAQAVIFQERSGALAYGRLH